MLLNAGKITEADLHRADQLHHENHNRSWSEIFRALDVVDVETLEKYVKIHVEECVYEVLDWQHGEFSFGERPIRDAESMTWIPVESLLMEGARRADELSALAAAIESPSAVPRLCSKAAEEGGILDLSPEEWEVVGRVDGTSDVKSISHTLGRSEFEVSKVISGLMEKGLLEIGSLADVARTKPPQEMTLDQAEALIERGDLDGASRYVDSVLKRHPEEPRAHFLAARILESEGDLKAAAGGYENTVSFDPLAEEARQRLGFVHLKLGNFDGAAHQWTAYLRMAPDSGERRRVERAMTALRELQLILSEFDGREHP
jgi:tetratricopeptide (TPR) repeat protein